MGAPKGNQFWKLRSKHGREKLFASPELLRESAFEYFQWCDENPWLSTKTSTSEKGTFTEEKPTQRPYSRMGWWLYIGCSESWLSEFKKTATKDFLEVISEIEQCIDKQQWEGASVGAFNANIIARTLGLKERTDTTTNDQPISNAIKVEIVRPEEDED